METLEMNHENDSSILISVTKIEFLIFIPLFILVYCGIFLQKVKLTGIPNTKLPDIPVYRKIP